MSLFSENLSRASTHRLEPGGHIDLADNTAAADEEHLSDLDIDQILPLALKRTTSWANPTRLREELSKRKYAKYSEEHYTEDFAHHATLHPSSSINQSPVSIGESPVAGDPTSIERTRTHGSAATRFRRGQNKIKRLLNSRRNFDKQADRDIEIDILYENQRGSWLLGTPLFSSKSLLNFDPAPWTTTSGKVSSVDITNAQLPDPSWEWVWKSWYVDMSLDVDEQGWQYNFMFNYNFAWHGTHPWFHAFVRRRRWIRERVRKTTTLIIASLDEGANKGAARTQKLNSDYFSVRAVDTGRSTRSSAYNLNLAEDLSSAYLQHSGRSTEVDDTADNIHALLRKLTRSNVDREKIHLVLEYMTHGGNDLHCLANEVPHIMSMLIFQHSRRELLRRMIQMIEDQEDSKSIAGDGEASGRSKQADDAETGEEAAVKLKIRLRENLVHAVEAADKEIKNLEFWSDIRQTEAAAESLGTAVEILDIDHPVQ